MLPIVMPLLAILLMEVHKEAIYFFGFGSNDKYMPIACQSKRIRRVVKSILAAETFAVVDLADVCIFYRKFLLEILQLKYNCDNIKIFSKTDNSCLYDSVHSSTQILDKRLRIEMDILREMIERKENCRDLLDTNCELFDKERRLFANISHQTRLDTRSKARRPIKVGIKGRGRSGTSWGSNPAGLCCSLTHLVQCGSNEASSSTNPNVGPGMYARL